MSYTPTEWNDNDEVTSAKLNNLESGVTAVGYEPTTWKAGDVVTAEKLNKLEQGVADASDVITSYLNRTITSFTITQDMFPHQDPNDEWWEGKDPEELDELIEECRWVGYMMGSGQITFSNCSKLTEINGLEWVYSLVKDAFLNCKSLTELHLPNAKEIGDVWYGESYAPIDGCGIKKISAPKVTGVGAVALRNHNLEYVYLPKVNKILTKAFQYDISLKHVYIGSDCTEIASDAFNNVKSGVIIDCGFAEGAVTGAPWEAPNATINYNVPDPGSIEAMIKGNN